MHTVLIEFNCKPGMRDNFLAILHSGLAETRGYGGALSMEPYCDLDDPNRVMVWEQWADRASVESYVNWRVETGFLEVLGEVLAEAPRMVHLSATGR